MVSGATGPSQSMPTRAAGFDRRKDELLVLCAEEAVFAGVGIEAADGDARARLAEQLHCFVAEFDGADDACGSRLQASRRLMCVETCTTLSR